MTGELGRGWPHPIFARRSDTAFSATTIEDTDISSAETSGRSDQRRRVILGQRRRVIHAVSHHGRESPLRLQSLHILGLLLRPHPGKDVVIPAFAPQRTLTPHSPVPNGRWCRFFTIQVMERQGSRRPGAQRRLGS